MNIDHLEIEPAKPLLQGAFCHYPQNTFHHINGSLDQFKKAERRKLDASYAQIERCKNLRYEEKAEFYESVWGISSGKAREQSEKSNRLVITRKSPTKDLSVNDRETSLRIYHREWSGEYRVSVESFTRLQEPPPPQSGERETSGLTERAASKIKDSGAYVAACKGGFKTFCTLTFTIEQRLRLAQGETTIGKEAARFFDALQKKITRGWTWTPDNNQLKGLEAPVRIEGRDHKLNYVWVAESPDTKSEYVTPQGEVIEVTTGVNPHIHFLMDWGVERELFKCWAAQIESIWGNGVAHLEKIRNPQSAVGYILKALGYMTKGQQKINEETGEVYNDQGVIKGNRYGISKDARAPDWECISEFEAAHMGQVVREVGERICIESGAIRARINQQKKVQTEQRANIAKLSLANYAKKLSGKAVKGRMQSAKTLLSAANAKIQALTESARKMDYSNKFKITFRAKDRLNEFIKYSVLKHGWQAKIKYYLKDASFESKSIQEWARKMKQDSELYWRSVMSEADSKQLLGA